MDKPKGTKQIRVSLKTYGWLKNHGQITDTFDGMIRKLIDVYEAVGKRFGKTSGGALSDAGCEALKMWIDAEKVKEKRKDMYSAVEEGV